MPKKWIALGKIKTSKQKSLFPLIQLLGRSHSNSPTLKASMLSACQKLVSKTYMCFEMILT